MITYESGMRFSLLGKCWQMKIKQIGLWGHKQEGACHSFCHL